MSTQIMHAVMGFEGKFMVGPPTGAMTELTEVRDPSIEITYTEVDVTTRRQRGMKAYQKGLKDVTVKFTLPIFDPPSAAAAIVLNSLQERRSPLKIEMESDGIGFNGLFELFSASKSEEGDNVQAWEITAKPSAAVSST